MRKLPTFTPPTIAGTLHDRSDARFVRNTTRYEEIMLLKHINEYFENHSGVEEVEVLVKWSRKSSDVLSFKRGEVKGRDAEEVWAEWHEEVSADAEEDAKRLRATKVKPF